MYVKYVCMLTQMFSWKFYFCNEKKLRMYRRFHFRCILFFFIVTKISVQQKKTWEWCQEDLDACNS